MVKMYGEKLLACAKGCYPQHTPWSPAAAKATMFQNLCVFWSLFCVSCVN